MNILLVSATHPEIEPLHGHLKAHWIESSPGLFTKGSCTVRVLITGIGMHRMGYALGKNISVFQPELCINAGIAGAFPGKADIGDVVHVTSESIVDLGAEDNDGTMLFPDAMGLNEDISSISELINPAAADYHFLKPVKGITVNTVTGSEASIAGIVKRWNPDIETMEGGAFFYCCLKEHMPFLEIRAISNLVVPRNVLDWDIETAVRNLNAQLLEILTFFTG